MKKKFTPEEASAKIKVLISNFYETCGREMVEDIGEARQELIEKIDDILNLTTLSQKHIIIERLELDEELKK